MAAVTDIGNLITSSPEIRGGRPRVAGTGVTVMRIAGWCKLGCSAEEIARKTGLSLAQIHAALNSSAKAMYKQSAEWLHP